MKTMVDAVVAQESDAKARVAGVRKRRTYSKQFKTEVGTPCLMPGASVSAVALSRSSMPTSSASGCRQSLHRKARAPRPAPNRRFLVMKFFGEQSVCARSTIVESMQRHSNGHTLTYEKSLDDQ